MKKQRHLGLRIRLFLSAFLFMASAMSVDAGVFLSSRSKSLSTDVSVMHLRCEQRENPMGLDLTVPRLSWQLTASLNDVQQLGYRVLVASRLDLLEQETGDLWDSGMVPSDQSLWIAYGGTRLQPNQRCYWKVQVKTNKGITAWSAPAMWSVGLLDEANWAGEWIGCDSLFAGDDNGKYSRLCARYFRKTFTLAGQVLQATLHLTGLGIYEAYLNGQPVGNQVLTPAPTDYEKSVLYNTYDVTGLLTQKANCLGVTLSGGRYFNQRHDKSNRSFGLPKLRANLVVEYLDGSQETFASGADWHLLALGPVRYANEYDGEFYDARLEGPLQGWTTVSYTEKNWMPVQRVAAPGGKLVGNLTPGMEVVDCLRPLTVTPKADCCLVDFGQNFTGWMRIKVQGKGQAGDTLRIRYAELLTAKGELYMENLRSAQCTDYYVFNGTDTGYWSPRFVYHGFRYAELTGYPQAEKADFLGEVISDPMERTGFFECSHPLMNQLLKNAYWGVLGNYKGFPIDCPQRDERMPWLGDRAMGCYGEAYLMDNQTLYSKWLQDIEQAMNAKGVIPDVAPNFWKIYTDNVSWPSVFVFAADMLYRQYGDVHPMVRHYPAMKRWLAHFEKSKMDSLGLVHADKYADWCVPPESPKLIHSQDPERVTDGTLIGTAYYYKMLQKLMEFVDIQLVLPYQEEVMGHYSSNEQRIEELKTDRAHYERQARKVKEAFNSNYLHVEEGKADGVYYGNNTVTANLLALAFNIVPEAYRTALEQHIVRKIADADGHLCCGVIGIQWLMRGLSDMGRMDVAYKLATLTTYPSWGYMIEQGATTIWELWNGNTASPKMNSGNHVMLLGDLLPWYFERIGGIRASAPAFREITFAPDFSCDSLSYAKAHYLSAYGPVESNWKRNGQKLEWELLVPANTTATVVLPVNAKAKKKVLHLTSGTHRLSVPLKAIK